jgi:hypothetical protein
MAAPKTRARDFFDAHVIINLPDSMSTKTKKKIKKKIKDKLTQKIKDTNQ